MATLIVIPNWERDFENSKSRQVENATFFCVQNHFDGRRIKRLQKLSKPEELYGAFHAIAAIASKCPYRGVLLDDQGPLTALDLADKTGFDVKVIARAMDQLSADVIGVLQKHEIEEVDGKWPLPVAVRQWAIHRSRRRRGASAGEPDETPSDTKRHQRPPKESPSIAAPDIPPRQSASPEIPAATPSDTERHGATRREGKGTEVPSTVSLGGRPAQAVVVDPTQAKQLICAKLLEGKDPGRMWSPDAENRLATMCKDEGGIPMREIEDIGWFYALPPSDDVPELKARRTLSETSLMQYWGDYATRSAAYRKKTRGQSNGNGAAAKPEPPRWQEFMRWRHDNPEITLPKSFWLLSKEHRADYEAAFQTFVNCVPAAPAPAEVAS